MLLLEPLSQHLSSMLSLAGEMTTLTHRAMLQSHELSNAVIASARRPCTFLHVLERGLCFMVVIAAAFLVEYAEKSNQSSYTSWLHAFSMLNRILFPRSIL